MSNNVSRRTDTYVRTAVRTFQTYVATQRYVHVATPQVRSRRTFKRKYFWYKPLAIDPLPHGNLELRTRYNQTDLHNVHFFEAELWTRFSTRQATTRPDFKPHSHPRSTWASLSSPDFGRPSKIVGAMLQGRRSGRSCSSQRYPSQVLGKSKKVLPNSHSRTKECLERESTYMQMDFYLASTTTIPSSLARQYTHWRAPTVSSQTYCWCQRRIRSWSATARRSQRRGLIDKLIGGYLN